MPADRHEDRADAPQNEQQLVAPKHSHIREHVGTKVTEIRAAARSGSTRGSDAHINEIVGRYANHTQDGVAGPGHGDGNTNDTLRDVLEGHRREMDLAAVTTNLQGGPQKARETAPVATTIEVTPPRDEKSRDPRSSTSPSRPSLTTMSQSYSYGPQNFGRSDVIDRPRNAPAIRMGGGQDIPAAPAAPAPAGGLAAISGRARDEQTQQR